MYKLVCSFSLEVITNVGLEMLLLSTYGFLFFLSNNDSRGKSMQSDLCHYLPLTCYKFSEYWRKVSHPRCSQEVLPDNYGSGTLHNVFHFVETWTNNCPYLLTYFIKKDNVNLQMLFILNLWFKFVPFVFFLCFWFILFPCRKIK